MNLWRTYGPMEDQEDLWCLSGSAVVLSDHATASHAPLLWPPLLFPPTWCPFGPGCPCPCPCLFSPPSLLPVFVLGPRRPHAPSLPHQGLVARIMETREVKFSSQGPEKREENQN